MKQQSRSDAARMAVGAVLSGLVLAGSSAFGANVYVSRFWHDHQPIYWPDWNSSPQNQRVQYAWDSINLKSGQNFGGLSSNQHPENNLTDIFGLDDRRSSYQGRPRDSLAGIGAAGGFAMSYSGSLIDNVRQLGGAGQLGYGSGWNSGNTQARGWKTPSGSPRLDLVGFTYHHSLAPLLPKSVFRKELQTFKQAWWKAWGGNSDLSDHSKGYFPTEMAFSTELIDVLAEEGYEWSIVASHHLSRTAPTYGNYANPTGTWNIFSSPPNKADQLGPSPTAGWWYSEPNPGNAAWNVSPFAYQLHKARYVNPSTGAEKYMYLVPSDDVLSYRFGYANEGIGKISGNIAPYATDPNKPVIVMPSSDGDNAWGGGFSSWQEATPQFFNDSASAGYQMSTPQDFVNAAKANADVVHIEDGAWIFPEMDYGSPYFLKWIEPPLVGPGASNRFINTNTDFESPGFALKFFSYAPLMAGANWCETAEQIYKSENGAGSVQAWRIQAPYDWNGAWNSPNVVELAWHIYLTGLDSGFNYYGGLGNDDEVKPGLATKNAIDKLQSYMSTRMNQDQTPPTVMRPQRFPWNPGGYTFGWFNTFGSGTNAAFLKKMSSSEFYIWTHAYDLNGITNIVVKVRKDNDGVNSMANNQNETYAGGGDVGSWYSISMNKRELPKTRSALNAKANNGQIDYVVFDPSYWANPVIADYYFVRITDSNVPDFRGKLLDYYIEAYDGRGNVSRSDIQHVFVENDGGGGPTPSEVNFSGDPRDCAPLTVTYKANGGALSNVTPVVMYARFTNSGSFAAYTMTNNGGGQSSYALNPVPNNAPVLQVYFQNSSGTITDNNGGANWSASIRDCDAPTGPSSVTFSNAPACSPVTITYYQNEGPLQTATQIFMHLGYNEWGTVHPSQQMTKVANNQWRISVTPDMGATNIVMVFNNGAGSWDNHNGQDWKFALNACVPAPVPNGIVITNPPSNKTVGNEVTQYSLQGTAGSDVVGLMKWTNALTGASGLLSAQSRWTLANVALDVGANVITMIGTNAGAAVVTNAADNASNGAYSDGWQTGDNGGSGFQAWTLYSTNGNSGHFVQNSMWGMWSHEPSYMSESIRPLSSALAVGETFGMVLKNGWIWEQGGSIGMALRNSSGDMLWQIYFNGGEQHYKTPAGESDINWTDAGLDIAFTVTSAGNYSVDVTPAGGSKRTYTGVFTGSISQVRVWSYSNGTSDGQNSNRDLYLNNLKITSLSGSGSSTSATVTITRQAGIGDTDGDGIPDSWEARFFGCSTCAVVNADSDGDGMNNWEEYIADTVPTNSASVWSNRITQVAGTGVVQLQVPAPTTNSRVYDVWSNTNLVQGIWAPLNLNVPGMPNGAALQLIITNTQPAINYRTGVKIPQ